VEEQDSSELVIGLVGAVGSDLEQVSRALEEILKRFRFTPRPLRLSDCFKQDPGRRVVSPIDSSSEYRRIETSIKAGSELRKTRDKDVIALWAAAQIKEQRDDDRPMARTVHILRSLKRPEEVARLRKIYGNRFLLISLYVPETERISYLRKLDDMEENKARKLIELDDVDGKHGQATSKAFELGDLFVDLNGLKHQLDRFFDLVFGSPSITPTADEHAMFAAYAASLRSGDLSRQVGAVVTTPGGTILSEGVNDAPKFCGEPYWPGSQDKRDIVRGFDENERIKRAMIKQILQEFDALEDEDPIVTAKRRLAKSGILDITEYGRAVHAEMSALMNCARLGIPTSDSLLYCTTFPCHNCAKHIVAAGMKQVRFIEPYPKSKALTLHDDAISPNPAASSERVVFSPFLGVGPRRYVELFSLRDAHGQRISRKDAHGSLVPWSASDASLMLSDRVTNYLDQEKWAYSRLADIFKPAE